MDLRFNEYMSFNRWIEYMSFKLFIIYAPYNKGMYIAHINLSDSQYNYYHMLTHDIDQ